MTCTFYLFSTLKLVAVLQTNIRNKFSQNSIKEPFDNLVKSFSCDSTGFNACDFLWNLLSKGFYLKHQQCFISHLTVSVVHLCEHKTNFGFLKLRFSENGIKQDAFFCVQTKAKEKKRKVLIKQSRSEKKQRFYQHKKFGTSWMCRRQTLSSQLIQCNNSSTSLPSRHPIHEW